MRRSAAGALLVAALAVLSACSDDTPPPQTAPETAAAPAWNPCSGLDPDAVAAEFDTVFGTRLGTPDAPLCTFTPQADGGPAIDVNYQTYVGSLEELLATFGILEEEGRTTVATVDVPGADDARLIVDTAKPKAAGDETIAITVFVQNGELVQILNVLDPAPFDREALTTDVTALAADLAANADTSGLVGSG